MPLPLSLCFCASGFVCCAFGVANFENSANSGSGQVRISTVDRGLDMDKPYEDCCAHAFVQPES